MFEWFSDLGDRFYRSVIYDERYLYFLEGLKNTLLIAFFAAILGFVIATVVSVIRDYHKETGKLKILNAISNIYVYIIRGTPTLLQLMILYYVVFRSVDISIITVGVLTFGINSGAYVAEIIRAGFDGVSRGQKEAAKTLGLSYFKTMKSIVFPQAIGKIFPALGNEVITLLKETSVASYIGIVELIKASDIISSRTYDYFFPLIITAIIYLFCTFILTKLISFGERRLNRYV